MMNLGFAFNLLRNQGVSARIVGDPSTEFFRVHTDSRSVLAGDMFVALKGDRFDAHHFLSQAAQTGAVAGLAHFGLATAALAGLEVSNSQKALAALATGWRAQFSLPLIAVTGSNGKTTVTQMIASILRCASGNASLATVGNLNNEIGVPLTLLHLRAHHQCAVVELGMNHPGEIKTLAHCAAPTVALVNNAQREHQEFMHTVEAVARENGASIESLPATGIAVFPAHDLFTTMWRSMAGQRRCLTFDLQGSADITGQAYWVDDHWRVDAATPQGAVNFKLAIAGRHNVKNALAAMAACLGAGISLEAIAYGLEQFEAVKGRSRAMTLEYGERKIYLVDDTYNANPDSVRAAIDVLAELPGPHLLILGDMGEVGEQGPEFHAEIGEYAVERGIETLLCTGELMRYCAAVFPGARHTGDMDALTTLVLAEASSHRSILIKGSRFMRLERLVDTIVKHGEVLHKLNTNSSLRRAHHAA